MELWRGARAQSGSLGAEGLYIVLAINRWLHGNAVVFQLILDTCFCNIVVCIMERWLALTKERTGMLCCTVGLTVWVANINHRRNTSVGLHSRRTSCGGMSKDTVRRSTLTKESVHGMTQNNPTTRQPQCLITKLYKCVFELNFSKCKFEYNKLQSLLCLCLCHLVKHCQVIFSIHFSFLLLPFYTGNENYQAYMIQLAVNRGSVSLTSHILLFIRNTLHVAYWTSYRTVCLRKILANCLSDMHAG